MGERINTERSRRDVGFERIRSSAGSFFVVVGDRAKDVIVHLHYIMSSVDVKQNKSVLWAYKNKLLGFSRCARPMLSEDKTNC